MSVSLAYAGGGKESSRSQSRAREAPTTTQLAPVEAKTTVTSIVVRSVPVSGPIVTQQAPVKPNTGSAPAVTLPSALVTVVSSPSSGAKNPSNTSVNVLNQPSVTTNSSGSVSIVTPLGAGTQKPVAGGVIVTSPVRVDVLPSASGSGGSTFTTISQFVPISGYAP